jgi:hypothetical protein
MNHKPVAAALGCLLLVPGPIAAQTVSTATAVITGTVSDRTGAALPGVVVTVSSSALMGNQTTRTTDVGSFRFSALAPGIYAVAFRLDGFVTTVREGIHVSAGFVALVDVTLELGSVADTVEVIQSAPLVDPQSTSLSTTFDGRRLAALPGSRTMGSVLAAAPSIYVTSFDVGGSSLDPGFYGAYGTSGFNRPMLEGLSLTGIVPTGFPLDFGSFEEITVGTGSHGPEWHAPGVQMQFISKSGGNQYRGTVYAGYEDRRWQSFNIDDRQLRLGAPGGGGLAPREANRLWSSRDINVDVGGFISRDAVWWYGSFRDQETAARQVNFSTAPLRTHLTSYTAKTTSRVAGHTLIAYGQAGRNARPFGLAGSPVAVGSAINQTDESTTRNRAWGWVGKLEWNASIGHASFLELRAGQFGGNRWERPNGEGPRREDIVTLVVSGSNRDWQNNFRRHQVLGSFSHFKQGWFGAHQIKGGGEIFLTTEAEIWKRAYVGDVLHVLRDGQPAEVYLFEAASQSESGLWTHSAYVHDSWRVHRRVTLNLGLRFDRYRIFLPEQVHPAGRFNPTRQIFPAVDEVVSWSYFVPRIGAAYDLSGDGRTVAKATYGRYRLAPGTTTGFNANPNSNQWWRRYGWSDVNASGFWEPGEEGPLLARRGGAAIESLDPDLDLPIVTEMAAWVDRELPARIALRTALVWRAASQYFMRVNANRPFSAFSVPIQIADSGPDGRLGTSDDGAAISGYDLPPAVAALPPVAVVRNVPCAASRHWTWEAAIHRRYAQRWSVVAAFAHVWNGDQAASYFGQTVRQNTYPVTPNDLINAGHGGRFNFRTWTAKVHGTFDGPWDLRLAVLLRHQSGQPFGRTFVTRLAYGTMRVLAEPIGTRRMDNVSITDVRVEKGIRLRGGRRVAGFIDVFNVFNTNPEQSTNWSSGSAFLQPLEIVPPRIAGLGLKVDW